MTEEVNAAMDIIKKACASVVADLENHQLIQQALLTVDAALNEKSIKSDKKEKVNA